MDNTISKITGFCDSPASQDRLGCENYFEGLAQFMKSCPTPMTIAIQGDWGTGKSTAMRIIENKIKDFGFHTIEFNTWKFSKSSGKMLIVPLIDLMIKELDKIGKKNKEYKNKFGDSRLKKLLTSVGGLCFLTGQGVLESFSGAGNVISDVKNAVIPTEEKVEFFEMADELHKDMQERIDIVQKINPPDKEDQEVKTDQIQNDDKRLVIFVDDLDRLAPEDAVNLLEDMKNIMDFENCIFVLALDHKIVMRGLSKKYGSIDKVYADRYFDKIIQLPFYLPVSSYKIDSFVKELNKEIGILSDDEVAKTVSVLDRFGDNNPRTIKRLLNLMLFYEKIGNAFLSEHKVECLALNLLQLNHTDYYETIIESMRDLHEIDISRILSEEGYYQGYYRDKIKNYWKDLESSMENKQDEKNDAMLSANDVISGVREIVNDDCMLLKKLIMATSVTIGNSVTERVQTTEETESLLDKFLKRYFDDDPKSKKTDNRSSNVYIVKDETDQGKEKYRITCSNRYSDHVNITVTQTDNVNITGLNEDDKDQRSKEIELYLEQLGSEYIVPLNQKNDDDFSILCESLNSVCLYNVSVKNNSSLLVTGKVLRNLHDKGVLFPVE